MNQIGPAQGASPSKATVSGFQVDKIASQVVIFEACRADLIAEAFFLFDCQHFFV
jgi:hypothetical protein